VIQSVETFVQATTLGGLSGRNGSTLLAIDEALNVYHSAAPARKRTELMNLSTAIQAWLIEKESKKKSRRRESIIALERQVREELERFAREAEAEAQRVREAEIEASRPRLRAGEDGYEYFTPSTGAVVAAKPEDWTIETDTDSQWRYYRNTVVHENPKWVEADDWDDLIDEQSHRIYYWNKITKISQWEKPIELTEERIAERQIKHLVDRTKWLPDHYYTVTSESSFTATMVPYRKSLSELNRWKEDNVAIKTRKVTDGEGNLCLTIREDVQRAKLTVGPFSERGKAKIDSATVDAWEGLRITNLANRAVAQDISRKAVILARSLLPLGAFNNRGGVQPEPATWSSNPGADMQRVEALAASVLGESTDFLDALVSNAASVRQIGGGVCSLIGALTAGILTIIAKPETEIILGSSSMDHTFCVISYKKCHWICADPWPLVSYPCRWAGSYFGLQAGPFDYYLKIDIHKPVLIPFGVAAVSGSSLAPTTVATAASQLGQVSGEIGHPYGHLTNATTTDEDGNLIAPERFDDVPRMVDKTDWGPAVDRTRAYASLGPVV